MVSLATRPSTTTDCFQTKAGEIVLRHLRDTFVWTNRVDLQPDMRLDAPQIEVCQMRTMKLIALIEAETGIRTFDDMVIVKTIWTFRDLINLVALHMK